MRNKAKNDAYNNVCKHEMSYRDIFDQSLYDEAMYEEYPDLQYSAVSEGADAKDIYHHLSRELPPRRLARPEDLTQAQKLSKLGSSSAKAK